MMLYSLRKSIFNCPYSLILIRAAVAREMELYDGTQN